MLAVVRPDCHKAALDASIVRGRRICQADGGAACGGDGIQLLKPDDNAG